MKNSKELRAIMHNAWNYVKQFAMSISNALKKAWADFRREIHRKALQKRFSMLYLYYELNPKSLIISWELCKIMWSTYYRDKEMFKYTINIVKAGAQNLFIDDFIIPFFVKYGFLKIKDITRF